MPRAVGGDMSIGAGRYLSVAPAGERRFCWGLEVSM